MIDEGSNKVKEYQFAESEKLNKSYSKQELARFRQQFETESLMMKVRSMVTQVMIEKADQQSGLAVTEAQVQSQVDFVMIKGPDQILSFLAENGVKLRPPAPPPPPRAGASPMASNNNTNRSGQPMNNGQDKIRNMVLQKLLKEASLSEGALAQKVNQIMTMPRSKILVFLQQPLPPPPAQAPRAAASSTPKRPYNWIMNCTDNWEYLPPPVQQALAVLGYNESSWNNSQQPASSDKPYVELSPNQQKAIRILGCNPQEWDQSGIPPPPSPPAEDDDTPRQPLSQQEQTMMRKVRQMVTFKLQKELNLSGDEPSDLLNRAVNEIMRLPPVSLQEYLHKPLLPPHVQAQMDSLKVLKKNWVWDSNAYWSALPPHIQSAAEILGYDEDDWNNTEQPEESDMKWRHLSIRQQEAATALGYDQGTWDEGEKDYVAASSDDDNEERSLVGEVDSDDESEGISSEKDGVAAEREYDESSDDEDQFIASFIEVESEDDNDGADELIANFISDDPNVVRELTKEDEEDELLDDDSVDASDIPYISNSIIRTQSSDDEDDDEEFYSNFLNDGKQRSGETLTEDETESTDQEKAPAEQKFSSQLETFMTLWSFKG